MVAPHEQCCFEEEVEGNEANNEIGDTLDDLEQREDDPIGQPQGIVFLRLTLDCLDALNKRIHKTNMRI